jgi:hypothetical protein
MCIRRPGGDSKRATAEDEAERAANEAAFCLGGKVAAEMDPREEGA